ncbi:MAG: General stress protein 16O [Candidatus Anoxychlamydiales bacterium]|nr:General stress protein 16O [Candidatus Anoxychlamydiales bacterium]NGX40927.1 General stress protein 16O [Candidatus Anoxychlamydiales bacterium]
MPLKPNEIEQFKKQLLELREKITGAINGVKEEVKELDETKGYSQHQADEGTDDFGKTINLEVSNKEYLIVKQIDRALEKIDEGTYGICDISQKEIPKPRLLAIPYATMTVDAQEKMEKGLL